ncbi:uncharacterized protein TA16640 [Theileria annulata]|uniref:DDHD domain-containing protein n=1 Tax=Theileria annulata TaxID=5874 RepID=Q4UJ00_THEAN|nr:uncharacterized protein TA16640 [Theileria annulata]CAI72939.1 hypothetical protein, conserved [Theileria annulata]|eukprot:XP_953617.1 hypothetical protein, conserved [Theileria annulata]
MEELNEKLEKLKSMLDLDFGVQKEDACDCILIAVHGIGTTENMLENDYKSLKHSLEVVRKHWFYNQKLKIHLCFINWKRYIVDAQNNDIVCRLFDNYCIDTMKGMRRVFNLAVMDIIFYQNPKFSDYLMNNIANDLNNEIARLRNHVSGQFKESKIAIIGYSMGSVLVYDLLSVNPCRLSNIEASKRPRLEHKIDLFFAIGSPLSAVLVNQNPQLMKLGLKLPEDIKYYNIFHPYDPIASRWEKLIYLNINVPKPVIVPYWYNNGLKNWYNLDQQFQVCHTGLFPNYYIIYCKSVIAENLTDFSNTITKGIYNLFGTNQNNSILDQNITNNSNKLKGKVPDERLNINKSESSMSDELASETVRDDDFFSDFEIDLSSTNALEKANSNNTLPKRYDYQVQEDVTEHFLNPLAILQSHISYWGSRDVSFFILSAIHPVKERVPLTTLLSFVESKAKALSFSTDNEDLKKEFLKVSEQAKKLLEQINREVCIRN